MDAKVHSTCITIRAFSSSKLASTFLGIWSANGSKEINSSATTITPVFK